MAPPEPPSGIIPSTGSAAPAPIRPPSGAPEQRRGPGRPAPAAAWLAWVLLSLSLLLVVAGLVFDVGAVVAAPGARLFGFAGNLTVAGTVVAFAVAGALIALRLPHNRIGWIFGAVGFFGGLAVFSDKYGSAGLLTGYRGALPGLAVALWLSNWTWIPVVLLPVTFILLLFPDGRLPSARWRPVAWSAGLGLAAYILEAAFGAWSGAFWFSAILALLLLVGSAGSPAAIAVRFRRSRGVERQQFKWLVYAGVFGFVVNVSFSVLAAVQPRLVPGMSDLALGLVDVWLIGIVAAAGLAILRYRLYDIDLLINRTLVYGAQTTFIVGLYVLVVGVSGELLHQSGSLVLSLLVTGLIAVLFQPVRERLQRFANRLLYGERDDPYAVLSRLGQRLEAALAPEAVLPVLAEAVAQALKLPYVAVALQSAGTGEPQVAAAYGAPTGEPLRFPLTYQSECVGELRVAPRGPGESFSQAERRLLQDIAHQAGVAAHAVRLTADLQRSRERLVSAREEERRRLRRDLHDGLGPALAIHSLKVGSVRSLLTRDLHALSGPGAVGQDVASADAVLAELERDIASTLADVRRLVYDLRPPTLDELGLVAAIRESAARYAPATARIPNSLRITLDAPERLPALPAAVEVAAFRITQEALTNVLRHAQARTCRICLRVEDGLWVEITDDGMGLPAAGDQHHTGVGLASMHERAAELGGTCVIEAPPAGGTRVLAHLPLG